MSLSDLQDIIGSDIKITTGDDLIENTDEGIGLGLVTEMLFAMKHKEKEANLANINADIKKVADSVEDTISGAVKGLPIAVLKHLKTMKTKGMDEEAKKKIMESPQFKAILSEEAVMTELFNKVVTQRERAKLEKNPELMAKYRKQAEDAGIDFQTYMKKILKIRVKALLDSGTNIGGVGLTAEEVARFKQMSADQLQGVAAEGAVAGASSYDMRVDAAPKTYGELMQGLGTVIDPLTSVGGKLKASAKKLGKKVTVGAKAAAKTALVPVKKPKKARALGRLPRDVLRMLANKKTAKRMYDAGLEMTAVLDKLQPAADGVSKILNSAAIPALQGTASASHDATSALATTVVMLSYVRDKLNEIQTAYKGILDMVVKVREEGEKIKGKHSASIKTQTGNLNVNIVCEINSTDIAIALEKGKTPTVQWSGTMGNQE